MGSDHRILTAKMKLSLRTCKAPARKPNYNWSTLRGKTLGDLYTVSVRNKYDALCQDGESSTETYAHLITANEEAAKDLLPLKKKARRKLKSTDPRVENARSKVQNASSLYCRRPTHRNREKLQNTKGKLQEAYDLATEEVIEKAIRSVETANDNARHGESWKLINRITGRKTSKKGIIKAKNAKEKIKTKRGTHTSRSC